MVAMKRSALSRERFVEDVRRARWPKAGVYGFKGPARHRATTHPVEVVVLTGSQKGSRSWRPVAMHFW